MRWSGGRNAVVKQKQEHGSGAFAHQESMLFAHWAIAHPVMDER